MMPPARGRRFRSILCAVDLSPSSARALRYAARLAGACGGGVTAIYAVDPLLTAAAAASDSRLIELSAQANLEAFVSASVRGTSAADVRSVVQVGPPGSVVVSYARHLRATIVVMGTHGRRGAAKWFFGSTTEAVLRRFRGPVLAIPPRCREPQPTWPSGSIVAAVDEGPHHRGMVSAAARMAEAFGAWLSLSTVTPATGRRGAIGMIILPLPPAARLRMLRQGSAAYRFICGAGSPVLVLRTRTRGRAVSQPSRAA